jgi:hypothetical protein
LVTESSCCKSVRRSLNLSGFLIGGSSCRERGCGFGATLSNCPGDLWRIEVAFQGSACANCFSQNISHCRLMRREAQIKVHSPRPSGWSKTPIMGTYPTGQGSKQPKYGFSKKIAQTPPAGHPCSAVSSAPTERSTPPMVHIDIKWRIKATNKLPLATRQQSVPSSTADV